ncbi:Uma2 family endonuclease [Planctomicrobium sp. SH668]|uniref:Uma2 family endonuclease n=1 Tax=Planctomicrobium sp. SH668 TaxID=3448126 RepID=UPI003F5B779B
MINRRIMTAEEFIDSRSELADGGQWSELIRGVPVSLDPPDPEYGNIVLNLSKAFSQYVHTTLNGYPCFDIGLKVESDPDTVFFPSVSYFLEGPRFEQGDFEVATLVPPLVIELATTADKRRDITERIHVYHRHGVGVVWVIDPHVKAAYVCRKGVMNHERVEEHQLLSGGSTLMEFAIPVKHLFLPPAWAQEDK